MTSVSDQQRSKRIQIISTGKCFDDALDFSPLVLLVTRCTKLLQIVQKASRTVGIPEFGHTSMLLEENCYERLRPTKIKENSDPMYG